MQDQNVRVGKTIGADDRVALPRTQVLCCHHECINGRAPAANGGWRILHGNDPRLRAMDTGSMRSKDANR